MYIAIYIPPQNVVSIDEINKLLSLSNKILIGGDINAKHSAWGNRNSNKSGKILMNFLINNNLNYHKCSIQHSDEPTHYPYNGTNETVLDIFIVKNVNVAKPYVINDLSSDHLPVLTYINPTVNGCNRNLFKLDFSKTNWQNYRHELNKNWTLTNTFANNDEVDETIKKLTDSMRTSLITATPIWKNTCTVDKNNDKIKMLINKRNKFRKNVQKNNCPDCKIKMKIYNNRIKYELVKHKNKQFKKRMRNLSITNGSLWNALKINKIYNNTVNKKIINIHGPNGITHDKKEIVNVLADAFEKIHYTTLDYGNDKFNKQIRNKFKQIIKHPNSSDKQTNISDKSKLYIYVSKIKNVIKHIGLSVCLMYFLKFLKN